MNIPDSSSYLNFVWLPLGVSIMMLRYSDFGPNGRIRAIFAAGIIERVSPITQVRIKLITGQ
jgi:hypothetical protein